MDHPLRCVVRWAERPGCKSNLTNGLQHLNIARLFCKTLHLLASGKVANHFAFYISASVLCFVCNQNLFRITDSCPMSRNKAVRRARVHTCRKDKHDHINKHMHTPPTHITLQQWLIKQHNLFEPSFIHRRDHHRPNSLCCSHVLRTIHHHVLYNSKVYLYSLYTLEPAVCVFLYILTSVPQSAFY